MPPAPSTEFPSDLILKIVEGQARIETKLDAALKHQDGQDEAISELRARVETLEKVNARSKGYLAALTAVGGIAGAIASTVAKYFVHP
jgi:hypothetical protein